MEGSHHHLPDMVGAIMCIIRNIRIVQFLSDALCLCAQCKNAARVGENIGFGHLIFSFRSHRPHHPRRRLCAIII